MTKLFLTIGWLLSYPFLYPDQVIKPESQLTSSTKSESCHMAKAGTMYVGSSLFQGVATGNVNIAPRGLGIAVLTGGIMAHVSAPLAAAETSFTDMLGQQTVHAVQTAPIHAAISMAIGQEKFGDAITSSLRHGVGHAIGASLAHQMGQWYSGPDKINYFMHKMGHFASGAVGGAITADDPLGGAFGAAFAEVSMEAADAKAEAALVKQENPNLPKEELKQILQERLIAKRFFSQVIGGFAGTLAGGDFSVAANAAAIALDYNMMPTLLDEACREYYGLTAEALDAQEAARPAKFNKHLKSHFAYFAKCALMRCDKVRCTFYTTYIAYVVHS